MGFLGRIFGIGKKKQVSLKISEVEAFAEETIAEKRKALLLDSKKRLSEVKHLLLVLNDAIEGLEAAEVSEDGNARLKRVARTSKASVARKLRSLAKKISVPSTSDPGKIREFVFSARGILQKELVASYKSLAYTGLVLKEKLGVIGEKVDEIDRVFAEMQKMFDENKNVFEHETIRQKTDEIKLALQRISAEKEGLKEINSSARKLAGEKEKSSSEIAEFRESGEFSALNALRQRKDEISGEQRALNERLLSLVSPLSKPLKKLMALVERKEFFLENSSPDFLKAVDSDILRALKGDPSGEKLKKLMRDLLNAMARGKIELKDKISEKAGETANRVLAIDFMGEFFWKENELQKELREIDKKIASNDVEKRAKFLEQKQQMFEKNLAQTLKLQEEKKALLNELNENTISLKNELEKRLSGFSDSNVSVALD